MLDRTVEEAADRFGDAIAVRQSDGRSLTFSELSTRSAAVAGRLTENHGVGEGTVVAVCTVSAVDYIITFAALARLGAVTVGISPVLSRTERATCIASLGADLVLGDPDLDPGTTPGITPLDTRVGTPGPPLLAPDEERVVCVVFTSGTTGPPKAAVFRNRQLRAVCDIDLGVGWQDRWGGGGPMIVSTQLPHVGFMTKLPWYLRMGGTLHTLEKWRVEDVLALIEAERIGVLGVVAPQLALLLRSPLLDAVDVSSVTSVIAGGAASPPELVREARRRLGAVYSIRYSSTESGGVGLATDPEGPDSEALHTVGRPRPGVAARIVTTDGADAEVGEIGELWLRSGAVADGYLGDPAATAATFAGGWLHTGDLAEWTTGGCVRLVGRSDDRYIRGGYNVAPAEVEAVLADHPGIDDVVVVPRAHPVMGSIGVAVVVPAPGRTAPGLEELRSHCQGRLAAWKQPEDVVAVDAIPLTAMHKVDRRRLIDLVDVGGSGDG